MQALFKLNPETNEQGTIKKTIDSKQIGKNTTFSKLILNFIKKDSMLPQQNIMTDSDNQKNHINIDKNIINILNESNIINENNSAPNEQNTHHIHLYTLLKIAIFTKSETKDATFPTELKGLKNILQKEELVNEFKNASSLKELFQIANKYNIKVENFAFTQTKIENNTPENKQITPVKTVKNQNLKSEEILKSLINQFNPKATDNFLENKQIITNNNQTINSKNENDSMLQNIFRSQPIQEKINLNKEPTQNQQVKTEQNITPTEKEIVDKSPINYNEKKAVRVEKNFNEIISTDNNDKKEIRPTQVQISEKPLQTEYKSKSIDQEQNKNILKSAVSLNDKTQKNSKVPSIEKQQTNIESNPQPIYKQNVKTDNTYNGSQTAIANQTPVTDQQIPQKIKEIIEKPKKSIFQNIHEIATAKTEGTKIETSIQTKESDTSTIQNKTLNSNDINTDNLHEKIKNSPDIKRTFNTFAEEFKEKVESYKPPLMKITIQLKPHNLGEVEVTLLNRGQNLQVNINSNPNTIALFSQNQAEFKNTLVNMGYTGLQMNFGQSNQNGQQQNQQKFLNKNTYKNFEFEESEEKYSQIELVIPRYI